MIALLHIVFAAAACFALWRAWRAWFGDASRAITLVVAGGFVIRAFAAQALFWISYLRLPVFPSLQTGNGYWFFALDAPGYLEFAERLLRRGDFFPGAIYPSHVFVQVLAVFVAAFGKYASIAILLNCAAYLATCAILIRLENQRAMLVALAAIAFGPAEILWSLQPLKDTFFQLLIAAMIAALFRWQRRPAFTIAIALLVLGYAIAGIRWYAGLILWAASFVFFAFTSRRAKTALANLGLFVLLALAVRMGGGTDIPPILVSRPAQATAVVQEARTGFDNTPAATTIQPAAPTFSARMISGFAAAFLPRMFGQALGLVRVGGGRGLWLFAELDTLVFDAVLLFAIVSVRRKCVTPLYMMLAFAFVLLAGPLVYTVNNFGTLFRLRQMLYFIAAALPLTASARDDRRAPLQAVVDDGAQRVVE
ncbi:MAG TPA: hypothetical protein VMU84_18945 [Thermoanaerobaculia bacterium]|nr:hypothetical protein [Thermoanaerobaculia bacterium]